MFPLDEELVNLGRGDDNQIALADDELQEHQASILRRNGRYAIYTPVEGGVEVDGNAIPIDQWIWLPESARLRLGSATLLQFRSESADGTATDPASPSGESVSQTSGVPSPSSSSASVRTKDAGRSHKTDAKVRSPKSAAKESPKMPPKPQERKGRKVARFITDQAGDRLVRLGEDGKLPQLSLAVSRQEQKTQRSSHQQSSPLIYVAVGISLVMSLAMLLIDADSSGSTAAGRARARRDIVRFYANAENPKPYQRDLRQAELAHKAGDRQAERRAYQRVLDRLNSEDVANSVNGLTGDKRDDEELRRLIGILMSGNE